MTATPAPRRLLVHWTGPADRVLYVWGDVAADQRTAWPAGHPFAGGDDTARFAWIRLAPGAASVGFLVVDPHGGKDVPADRYADPRETPEILLRPGDPRVEAVPADPPGPAAGAVVVHYRPAGADPAACALLPGPADVDPAAAPDPGAGPGGGSVAGAAAGERAGGPALAPEAVDAFGAVFRLPVPPGATAVRFTVGDGDQRILDPRRVPEVWLLAGDPLAVRPEVPTGPALDPARTDAVLVDRGTVALPAGHAAEAATVALLTTAPDETLPDGDALSGAGLPLTPRPGGLFRAQLRRRPDLAGYAAYAVPERGDAALAALLAGRLLLAGRDAAGRLTVLTGVRTPGDPADLDD